MKLRILGIVLLAMGAASFVLSLNVTAREHAYALLCAAYLLFILAVITLVSKLVGTSPSVESTEQKQPALDRS